jgi:Ca2+-binding RTX toxin-like protein
MFDKRSGLRNLGVGTLIWAASACGVPQDSAPVSGPDDDFTGTFELLAAACTFDVSGNPTLTVNANETAYLFKRAADGLVVANALTAGAAECTFATTKKVTINNTAATNNHKILLDYYGGTFGIATAAFSGTVAGSGPKTVITMTGTGNQVKVRGTPNADTFTFGTLTTTSYLTTGVGKDATTLATPRTFPDVSMTGVTDIVVSAGPGNDVITGQGGVPIGGTVAAPGPLAGTINMTIYGGLGNDTITSGGAGAAVNHLYGEDGNDTFLQQAALAHDIISGTNAGGAADTDVVDYSVRTGALTVTFGDDAAASAATGSVVAVAQASMANFDTFSINNGTITKVFEFEQDATGWTPTGGGVIVIDITAATTNITVGTAVAAAITTAAIPGLTVTDLGTGTVSVAFGSGLTKPAGAAITKGAGAFSVVDFVGGSAAITANDGEATEADSINADIENMIGGAGADRLDASLSTLVAHVLQGMGGDDTLTGSTLTDTLWGGAGDDTMYGGAGIDVLNGGDGNDTLQGGIANDTIDGGGLNCVASSSAICTAAFAAKSTVAGINPGTNTLDFADRSATVTVDLSNLALAVTVGVAGEKDVVTASSITYLRGGSGADTLTGDASNNIIWGGGGIDTIVGGAGNDALYGEAGNDIIDGGLGDDFISGGAGGNALVGGSGNDFIDNTAGTAGSIDCGAGDADVGLTNGTETAVLTCE